MSSELSPDVEGGWPSTAPESGAVPEGAGAQPYEIPQADAAEFGALQEGVREEVLSLLDVLKQIEARKKVDESCKFFAAGLHRSWHRLRAQFYAYRKTR